MIRLTGLVDLQAIKTFRSSADIDETLDPVGKEDKDVDNDGDTDEADKYLKNRRGTIAKNVNEEEYDTERDARDMRSLFGTSDDDDDRPHRGSAFSSRRRSAARRTQQPLPQRAPIAQQPAQTRDTLLQQKVKYTDTSGKEHEATVKSLLGYPKDHPGRKIAARMYAQHMAKTRTTRENINEQDEENPMPSNDHEVSMANNSLDTIIQQANELKSKLGEMEKDIPAWIQDHITNAANYIAQAANNYHEHNTPDEPQPDQPDQEAMNESVKGMKKHKKIDSPFALAQYMKKQTHTSRKGK